LILGDLNDVTFYAYQPPPLPNDVTFYAYQPDNTIAINAYQNDVTFMLISRHHHQMMFILMLISPTI
jgi:hypothetical protein